MGLLRRIILVSIVLLAGKVASAQALPTATGPGTSIKIGAGYSAYHIEYGQRWLGGAQLWADANLFWRTGLELEARQLRQNQDLSTHADTYLLGPRVSLFPRRIEPYAKVLVGVGKMSYPYGYASGRYFVASGGAGVDLHLNDRVQVRLIDVQYQDWPKFTFGATNSYGVSAGVIITVYRGRSWISE